MKMQLLQGPIPFVPESLAELNLSKRYRVIGCPFVFGHNHDWYEKDDRVQELDAKGFLLACIHFGMAFVEVPN